MSSRYQNPEPQWSQAPGPMQQWSQPAMASSPAMQVQQWQPPAMYPNPPMAMQQWPPPAMHSNQHPVPVPQWPQQPQMVYYQDGKPQYVHAMQPVPMQPMIVQQKGAGKTETAGAACCGVCAGICCAKACSALLGSLCCCCCCF